jgi:hypothetical protein
MREDLEKAEVMNQSESGSTISKIKKLLSNLGLAVIMLLLICSIIDYIGYDQKGCVESGITYHNGSNVEETRTQIIKGKTLNAEEIKQFIKELLPKTRKDTGVLVLEKWQYNILVAIWPSLAMGVCDKDIEKRDGKQ